MQDYKSLRVAVVMIFYALVNTQTHTYSFRTVMCFELIQLN